MKPFTFETPKDDLARFEAGAKPWKPGDFNAECDLRLDYYLDRQLDDTRKQLQTRFPQSWNEMMPVTLPITSCFVNEAARVFLNDTVLDLVDDKGEPLKSDDELAKWWTRTKEAMGLAFRLKNVDRYTTLHRTCFLKIVRVRERMAAQIFFAHRVDAVFDPAYPMDLDMAYAVRLEVGSESPGAVLGADGKPAQAGGKRFEFWCGRPKEKDGSGGPLHALVREDGTVDEKGENPFGELVPLVMFTAHSEELGPFVLAKQGLHLFNRALNIAATDEQHIAEAQGYGQLFITVGAGGTPPSTVVRGPNRAIALPEGCDAKMLNGNAPISDLLARMDASIKRAAVLNGIPPGSVSLEARAVASGIALQIEMRPLLEIRQDAIEVYQSPVARVWKVIRAVHNATIRAAPKGEKEIPETVGMRWRPGDVQMPVDPHVALDDIVVKLSNRLISRVRALAELEKLPLEEAKQLAKQIDEEDAEFPRAPQPGPGPAGAGSVTAGAREKLKAPGAQRAEAAPQE